MLTQIDAQAISAGPHAGARHAGEGIPVSLRVKLGPPSVAGYRLDTDGT